MAPVSIKHYDAEGGRLGAPKYAQYNVKGAPASIFGNRRPVMRNNVNGALSNPIKRVMHEVGPLASQMLSMQVYLKGAPASVLVICALSCEIASMLRPFR